LVDPPKFLPLTYISYWRWRSTVFLLISQF